jgi:defect-in-organelle-trafficking protein DotC
MGICSGFQSGVNQANMIFTDRLTRLVRDYTGMLRFRTLAAQQVVSMPRIDEGHLGVSVQSDRVHVDDRIIRITDPVRFNHANQWRAVPGINR